MAKRKNSLGRDAFEDKNEAPSSNSLKNLIKGSGLRGSAEAKAVAVQVKLTPSNLKHLDNLTAELERQGKGSYSRDQLIRVAIALLTPADF
ncbi:MAG: hypothetical protein ABIA59_01110 [Candidatus Latescibacterota bacterium]